MMLIRCCLTVCVFLWGGSLKMSAHSDRQLALDQTLDGDAGRRAPVAAPTAKPPSTFGSDDLGMEVDGPESDDDDPIDDEADETTPAAPVEDPDLFWTDPEPVKSRRRFHQVRAWSRTCTN
jgi:hypothetical protein